jgi:uncharacterized protein YwgA
LTRTKLVKLLYLIDLLFYKKKETTLTGLKYVSYYYGPYAPEIIEAVNSLNNFEIQEEMSSSLDGNTYYLYSVGVNSRLRCDIDKILKSEEKEVADEILAKHGNNSLDYLLKEVYATREYKNTSLGKEIKFK